MFLDSHDTVYIFRCKFDLLDVVLVFMISILNLKSLQSYWHRVTDVTSFGKRLESSLGHTLNFCPNLVQYRFKDNLSPVFYWDLVFKQRRVIWRRSEFHRVRLENSETPSKSSVWPSNHWEDYLCLALLQPWPCADHSLSVSLWLTRRVWLYDGPCL